MKKLDVRELIEVWESLEAHELKERINKILRMSEEDEAFEVIDVDAVRDVRRDL